MKQFLFFTDHNLTGTILRLTLGFIMLPHGAQKLFGLFGGNGFEATMNYFTENMKLPWIIAFLVIVIEFLGPIGLIAGFGSRLCAALICIIMIGAIVTTNYSNGFFMNWFGNQNGEGFEYHLLIIGICIALIVTGSGGYSIDGLINRQ